MKLPRPLVWLWILVYANGVLFLSGLGGNDGWGYYANLETILIDHDLMFDNNVHAYIDEDHALGLTIGGPVADRHGGASNQYPWGHTLVYAVPFLAGGWVHDVVGVDISTDSFPEDSPYRGQSSKFMFRVLCMSLWTCLLALVLISLFYLWGRQLGASSNMAAFAAFIAWWSSPLPFYAVNAMTHTASCLFLLGSLMLASSHSVRPWLSGLLMGLSGTMRVVNGVFTIPLGLSLWQQKGWRVVWKAALTFSLVYALNFLSWYLIAGDPFDSGYGANTILQAPEHQRSIFLWNVTFDLHGGLFVWFPAMLPAFGYVCVLAKRDRAFLPFLLGTLLLWGVIGFRHEFHGAGGYANRYLSPLTVLLFPGVVALVKSGRFRGFIFLSLVWSTALYLIYSARLPSVDPNWNEMGRHIATYFTFFKEHPLSEWGPALLQSSKTISHLMRQPLLLLAVLVPPLVLLGLSRVPSGVTAK